MDEPSLRAVAGPLGLDAERLRRGMDGARAVPCPPLDVVGVVGTPALVVGRTLMVGAVPAGTMRAAVLDERAMPTPVRARRT